MQVIITQITRRVSSFQASSKIECNTQERIILSFLMIIMPQYLSWNKNVETAPKNSM